MLVEVIILPIFCAHSMVSFFNAPDISNFLRYCRICCGNNTAAWTAAAPKIDLVFQIGLGKRSQNCCISRQAFST